MGLREIGRGLHPRSIRVHASEVYEEEEDQDGKNMRDALGIARGWIGTNERMPTDEELEGQWMEITAKNENTGVQARLYLGDDDSNQWYFQIWIQEEKFKEYINEEIAQERDWATSRLRILEKLLNFRGKDLDKLDKIMDLIKER